MSYSLVVDLLLTSCDKHTRRYVHKADNMTVGLICYIFVVMTVRNSCVTRWSFSVFGRPFVKRFTLCYKTAVCLSVLSVGLSVCLSLCQSVCDYGALWSNGWMDQRETWQAGRPRHWPHSVRWGPSSPSPKGNSPSPNFRPMPIVAKRLDGSRCHVVWR